MSNRFGGEWTVKKLDCVRRYLEAYVKVMKNQHQFATHYIDAFAGSGYVDLRQQTPIERGLWDELTEAEEGSTAFLEGSASQSLNVQPPFDNYLFIEKNAARANELQRLQFTRLDLEGRIQVIHGDANQHLRRICGNWRADHRGVVFLDPFAMQVQWETLSALAATKCLDVWYLVSVSAINRLLPHSGRPPEEWRPALRRTFGTEEWEDHFYRPSQQPNLFDDAGESVERVVSWQKLCGFVLSRLNTIFDAVAPDPLLLRNTTNSPLFLLCFAMNSPVPEAQEAALRIANHILGMNS